MPRRNALVLNRALSSVTCAIVLCAEGWGIGNAHAQYPATGDYDRYSAAGTSPGVQQVGPQAPYHPSPTTRPETWPNPYTVPQAGQGVGAQPYGPPAGAAAAPGSPPVAHVSSLPSRDTAAGASQGRIPNPQLSQARPLLGAHIVARVGNEVITVSDVLAQVPGVIERSRGKIPDDILETQREALTRDLTKAMEEAFARQNGAAENPLPSEMARAQLLSQLLNNQIQTLLVFLDAKRNIPEEGMTEVSKQIDQGFEKQMAPELMKRYEASSRRDLEDRLHAQGTSLDREKRGFFQQTLAQQWIRQHVDFDKEITHEQMLEYYRAHPDAFDREARTVWEELCVQFVDQPSVQEASAAIASMGNRVLAGEPFADVAKDASQGPTASDGGRRVWPEKGEYLSEELERAITSLPVGQLSPIVRDWRGLHIVRVIERTPAGRLPFKSAQSDIRKSIREERVQKQLDQYVDELKQRTSISTILDPKPAR